MTMRHCFAATMLALTTMLAFATPSTTAALISMQASGTISSNSSHDDVTIPLGTPWEFKLIYDTAAPDLDFELTGSVQPDFGRFTNTASPPALTYFRYQAGDYVAVIDDPAGFGEFSNVLITFTVVHAIDINIHAVDAFPPLAGGPVSFHADFNAFSAVPILSSDALPTNLEIGPEDFDQSTISLLPTSGAISGSELTTLSFTPVIESPAGDTNGDGVVDIVDLNNVRNNFAGIGLGDTDGDLDVDINDLNAVRNNFGAGAETAAVPEPASSALLVVLTGSLAGAGVASVRRAFSLRRA
jgi:hypothetical protein